MKALDFLQQEAVCGAGDTRSLGSSATVVYQISSSTNSQSSSGAQNGASGSQGLSQEQATCVGRIESAGSTGGVLGGLAGAAAGFAIGGPVGAAVGIALTGLGVLGGGAWGASNTPACNPSDGYTEPVPAQGGYIER
jgi:hypothetical protein